MGILRIPLSQGKETIIDEEDYSLVAGYAWYAIRQKDRWYAVATPYILGSGRGVSKKMIYLHKLLLLPRADWRRKRVDHEDRDGLNNRRSNIRIATPSQNGGNARKGDYRRKTLSKYKGVTAAGKATPGKPWRAQIRVQGKLYWLGNFTNEDDAAKAYDAGARKYFGEFARTNFP